MANDPECVLEELNHALQATSGSISSLQKYLEVAKNELKEWRSEASHNKIIDEAEEKLGYLTVSLPSFPTIGNRQRSMLKNRKGMHTATNYKILSMSVDCVVIFIFGQNHH